MPRIVGPLPALVISEHDGDTITMRMDLGFGITLEANCRVFGINAPELATPEGKTALAYAQTLIAPGDPVTVISHGWDKYGGRFDGSITLPDGRDFAQVMLDSGHAVPLIIR